MNNRETIITNIYRQHSEGLTEGDLSNLINGNKQRILMGDFNAKSRAWNSTCEDVNGRKLFRFAANNNSIIIGPVQPTYIPINLNGLPQVLDIALLKNINLSQSYHHNQLWILRS